MDLCHPAYGTPQKFGNLAAGLIAAPLLQNVHTCGQPHRPDNVVLHARLCCCVIGLVGRDALKLNLGHVSSGQRVARPRV